MELLKIEAVDGGRQKANGQKRRKCNLQRFSSSMSNSAMIYRNQSQWKKSEGLQVQGWLALCNATVWSQALNIDYGMILSRMIDYLNTWKATLLYPRKRNHFATFCLLSAKRWFVIIRRHPSLSFFPWLMSLPEREHHLLGFPCLVTVDLELFATLEIEFCTSEWRLWGDEKELMEFSVGKMARDSLACVMSAVY